MRWARQPAAGAVVASALVAALCWALRNEEGRGVYERAERTLLDARLRLRGPTPSQGQVAIVSFDDATAARGSKLLERRAGWAKVVRAAQAAGARTIGVDAIFSEPEEPLGPALGAQVAAWAAARPDPEPGDEAGRLLAEVARELRGDAELAAALAEARSVVLALWVGQTQRDPRADPAFARARFGQSTTGDRPPRPAQGVEASLPAFTAAAAAMGFASVYEDQSGQVRRVEAAVSWGDGLYQPLAVAMLAAHLDVPRGRLAYLGPQQELRLGDRTIPLQDGAFWLHFRGPGAFPSYSAIDLLDGKLPPGALQGKAVLLGQTRLGYDSARGPFGPLPGVEVQATALDNLLAGDPLRRSGRLGDLAATLGLGLLTALLFASSRLGLLAHLSLFVAAVGGWLAASSWALSARGLWLPWLGPVAAALAALFVGQAIAWVQEAGKRRFLKRAFAHYLGSDALEQLLASPEKLELGGERRQLTVLFSDICGFTTLAEKLAPDRLVAFLNTYLSPMTRAVLAQGGLLDKYIGDAVMAVFGAPVPLPNHAATALDCALAMHRDLEALNQGPLAYLGAPLRIGVGVNTGDMVVGNMGSAERFDYTVAGDSVNLASRLEGLTRTYGVFCLVGEATQSAAGAGYGFRSLDLVQVKGKQSAVEVFELLGGPSRTVARYEALDLWSRGLAAFRAGRLPEAREAFEGFQAVNPGDVPARRYLERLAELPATASPGFSPVAVFHEK